MEEVKRGIYEMDAIESMQEEAFNKRMESQGYEKCKICEHWVEDDELTCNICESCIDEIIDDTTLEDIFEYASTLDKDNELILYIEYLFNGEQVIEILKEYARKTEPKTTFKKGIRDYIECDVSHYIEYLDRKGCF